MVTKLSNLTMKMGKELNLFDIIRIRSLSVVWVWIWWRYPPLILIVRTRGRACSFWWQIMGKYWLILIIWILELFTHLIAQSRLSWKEVIVCTSSFEINTCWLLLVVFCMWNCWSTDPNLSAIKQHLTNKCSIKLSSKQMCHHVSISPIQPTLKNTFTTQIVD